MVYGLVALKVHVVVLEHGHPLREDGEDVPLLDRVVDGQACGVYGLGWTPVAVQTRCGTSC